jgi:hypothetical protein
MALHALPRLHLHFRVELPHARKIQWCKGLDDAVADNEKGHTLQQATFNGDPITFCNKCGKWMSFRAKGLASECGPPSYAGKVALRDILIRKRHPLKHRRGTLKHDDEEAQPRSQFVVPHADTHHAQVVAKLVAGNKKRLGRPWHTDDLRHQNEAAQLDPASPGQAVVLDDPALQDPALDDNALAAGNLHSTAHVIVDDEDAFDFGEETSNARRPVAMTSSAAASSSSAPVVTPAIRDQITTRRDSATAKKRARKDGGAFNVERETAGLRTPASRASASSAASSAARTTAASGIDDELRDRIEARRDSAKAKRKAKVVPVQWHITQAAELVHDVPERMATETAVLASTPDAASPHLGLASAAGQSATSASTSAPAAAATLPATQPPPAPVVTAEKRREIAERMAKARNKKEARRREEPTQLEASRRASAFEKLEEAQRSAQPQSDTSTPASAPAPVSRTTAAHWSSASAASYPPAALSGVASAPVEELSSESEAEVAPKPYTAPDAPGATARRLWCDQEESRRQATARPAPTDDAPTTLHLSSSSVATQNPAAVVSPREPALSQSLRTTLLDLLDLADFGETVEWPAGYDARIARLRLASP